MEEVLNGLFVFSGGEDPLFLSGSAGVPQTEVHGNHFIPSEVESNGALLSVFTTAIANNVANFPLSSTVSSQTFSFVGGVPTPTSNSFGPIFAERAQTMGRGRFDVGISRSTIKFDRIRGTPLDDVELAFIHENSDFPPCSTIFGGDCSQHGFPLFEHDVINLGLDLDIRAEIYAFNATFGILDWLDVGVAVPVVELTLEGSSVASIQPADIDNLAHFFGGDPANPILSANSTVSGSTRGVGDIAARLKTRVLDGEELDVALLGEIRLPTGRKEDFLGSGELSGRGLFIASATLADFSPHVNLGYMARGGESTSNGIQFVAGFDQRLSDWATFAADLLGEFKMGDSHLDFPEPFRYDPPLDISIERANVPNFRDDILDGSVGFKFRTDGGLVVVANALIALNEGGMRARIVPTFGLQYSR
jgi:hypothetical protein